VALGRPFFPQAVGRGMKKSQRKRNEACGRSTNNTSFKYRIGVFRNFHPTLKQDEFDVTGAAGYVYAAPATDKASFFRNKGRALEMIRILFCTGWNGVVGGKDAKWEWISARNFKKWSFYPGAHQKVGREELKGRCLF